MSYRQLLLSICVVLVPLSAQANGGDKHKHHDDHWMAPKEKTAKANPVPATEESIRRGKEVYNTNCAVCHGADGRADTPAGKALKPPAADLVTMGPQHSDGDFAWKIAKGRGPMPPWKDSLSEQDIWHVVNYIRTLAK